MNAAKQIAWLFSALLALACSSLYFASSKPVKRLHDLVLSKTADMVVINLSIQRFDETGKMANDLQSSLVQHIPENSIYLFKQPLLTLTKANQPPWKIKAKQAKAIKDGEQITFIQDVIIHQGKGVNGQESTIKTDELDYFSKTKIASTDLPVRFEQPGTLVLSKGMNVYFDEKRVQLSHARATIEPKHG